MHASRIYKSIYKYLGKQTPLPVDCGQLCNKACCASDDDDTGMYLFPCEEKLFLYNDAFKVFESDFIYGNKAAKIVTCKGVCDRNLRPLSCRIFPLVPYYKNGALKIILDPRAKNLCPICHIDALPYYNKNFRKKVYKIFSLLTKFKKVRLFLEGLTDILDDYIKFETGDKQ